MDENMKKRFDGISGMISNTPLLEIQFLFKGQKRRIFAKAEAFNLTGSIKDRVAYYILKKHMKPEQFIREIKLRRQQAEIPASLFQQWGGISDMTSLFICRIG